MVFAIKCIIACVLFTIALEILAARQRDVFVNDYPPIVTASENVSEAVSMSGQNPENSMSV